MPRGILPTFFNGGRGGWVGGAGWGGVWREGWGTADARYFSYKNTENLAEPQIFLTSACYFLNLLSLPPFKGSFKLHFRMKAFLSHTQIFYKTIFLELAKNIEPNLSLSVL